MEKVQNNYKYKLNEFIEQLPRQITIGAIETVLSEKYHISRDKFYRDRNIRLHDSSAIPSDRLDIYAGLFNTTPDRLKNYSIEVKPLMQMPKVDKAFIKKTGLTK